DLEAAARVGREAGGGEVQLGGGAVAADGVEERLAGDDLVARERRVDAAAAAAAALHHVDPRDGLAEAQAHAHLAHAALEQLGQLLVDEVHEARAGVDERDADADDGEHAGVLGADHAA